MDIECEWAWHETNQYKSLLYKLSNATNNCNRNQKLTTSNSQKAAQPELISIKIKVKLNHTHNNHLSCGKMIKKTEDQQWNGMFLLEIILQIYQEN